MAISRKPRPISTPAVDVEALINKGGTPPASLNRRDQEQKFVPVVVRFPSEMIEQIDHVLKARPIRTPRHTWLLEAAHEKLTRELDG